MLWHNNECCGITGIHENSQGEDTAQYWHLLVLLGAPRSEIRVWLWILSTWQQCATVYRIESSEKENYGFDDFICDHMYFIMFKQLCGKSNDMSSL